MNFIFPIPGSYTQIRIECMLDELMTLDQDALKLSVYYDIEYQDIVDILDLINRCPLNELVITFGMLMIKNLINAVDIARIYHSSEHDDEDTVSEFPVKYIDFVVVDFCDMAVFFDHETAEVVVRTPLNFLTDWDPIIFNVC